VRILPEAWPRGERLAPGGGGTWADLARLRLTTGVQWLDSIQIAPAQHLIDLAPGGIYVKYITGVLLMETARSPPP
jgi:hypothetical protein